MSSVDIRANLRAAKEAIQKKSYTDALEYVDEILEEQADHYLALVFRGKCFHMLSKLKESGDSYSEATKLRPKDPIAWRGLLELYQEQKNGPDYLMTLQGLMLATYDDSEPDQQKLHEARSQFNHAVNFVRSLRNKQIEKQFLYMQLPSSPIYPIIEGHGVEPYTVLSRLTGIIETEENDMINKHTAKGRLRIDPNAPPLEFIKYQLYSQSDLPAMWRDLLNMCNDDVMRRNIEGRLIKHRYALLCVAPTAEEKEALHDEIFEMAQDMVLLNSPEPLAWKIFLEWQDFEEVANVGYETLKKYVESFPREGLAQVLEAFLASDMSPFQETTKKDTDENKPTETPEEEELIVTEEMEQSSPAETITLLAEGYEKDDVCILSHRIVAAYYVQMQEYETAIDIINKGLALIKNQTMTVFNNFDNGTNHLNLLLGNSYIYYQAPKNYDAALRAFSSVLELKPDNVEAILGQSIILREKGGLSEVKGLLQGIVERYPDNFRAHFELAVCLAEMGDDNAISEAQKKFDACLAMITEQDPLSLDRKAQIWWRKGEIKMNILNRNTYEDTPESNSLVKEAYDCFVQSLHHNMNFASTYTSLGLLYQDWIQDQVRASKCFYRAFELDAGQIKAAKMLAQEFANKAEWDLVEVLASRVVESDKVRTYFVKQSKEDECWPYRALGIVALNKADYAKAVLYLQQSLRIFPEDANSWMGLGEAYTASGRFTAGTKAYDRALLFKPNDPIIMYHKACVDCNMQEYSAAIKILCEIESNTGGEGPFAPLFLHTLIQTCVSGAKYSLDHDMYSLAVERAMDALSYALRAVRATKPEQSVASSVWRNIAYACDILRRIQEHKQLSMESVKELLKVTQKGLERTVNGNTSMQYLDQLFVEALQCALDEHKTKAGMAHGWFELGLGYYELYKSHGEKEDLQNSMDALKRSIELESKNSSVWDAYGVVSRNINNRVAQHAFIRSLSLNPRSARAYTNLAALYISLGDIELASEAIDRALSIDAQYVGAWVCQAVSESVRGNTRSSEVLFEHSNSISTGSDPIARLMYGIATYEKCVKSHEAPEESGILALQKYLTLKPRDGLGLLVAGTLLERSGNFELAATYIQQLCSEAEQQYEKNESLQNLMKYIEAKTQLARLYLGGHKWEQAIEEADTVLKILDDESDSKDEAQYKFKLSASLTAGLAHYFMKDLEGAIDQFQVALELSNEDQDVVILLAQVLWANGGDNEKEAALEQLFNSISSKGSSTKIVLVLGVLGLVSDPELLEAAGDEIDNLSQEDLNKDTEHNIQEISAMIKKSAEPWQRASALWPNSYNIWRRTDPKIALRLAKLNSSKMSSQDMSQALIEADPTVEMAQRALYLSPGNQDAWQTLAKEYK